MSQLSGQVAFNPVALSAIASKFVIQGNVTAVTPLGNGNINSTFLVTVAAQPAQQPERRFVLQRINTQVFRQPQQIIQNMTVLCEHLKALSQTPLLPTPSEEGHQKPSRRWETPQILPTVQGENFWIDEAGDYWRAISFIEDAHVFETVESSAHAREIGYGLARFHQLISTLPAEKLADTLEGFHITPMYLAAYKQVLQNSTISQSASRSAGQVVRQSGNQPDSQSDNSTQVNYCLNFIEQRQDWAQVLEQAKAAGKLQLRPIHGDPKVNNIMLGPDGRAVSLIDLDTLKPGLVHYDIGDCLRSSCNHLGEETTDWQAVFFDTDLAQAVLEGYLSLARDFLSEQDYDYLYDAIRLIAFELGLRFFTDYLAGNVYFKVKHPTHNLTRALVQFKLTESIEAQADILQTIIQNLRP